ncbi:hypothetical protein CEXT_292791 [Caerostris extrusa]|uniref:Uncharacterized protein n=1 Tax=Caerostris extrusa TaxID=172846 RepID=A0AAV4PJG2_CAEEX|nr:hypothetical protein CEXT_292791 [Caerostris extrusa]
MDTSVRNKCSSEILYFVATCKDFEINYKYVCPAEIYSYRLLEVGNVKGLVDQTSGLISLLHKFHNLVTSKKNWLKSIFNIETNYKNLEWLSEEPFLPLRTKTSTNLTIFFSLILEVRQLQGRRTVMEAVK